MDGLNVGRVRGALTAKIPALSWDAAGPLGIHFREELCDDPPLLCTLNTLHKPWFVPALSQELIFTSLLTVHMLNEHKRCY